MNYFLIPCRLLFLLVLQSSCLVLQSSCLRADTLQQLCVNPPSADGVDSIRVSGVVQISQQWGPPNFGETPNLDTHFDAYIMTLDHPLVVREDRILGNGEIIEVKSIQLFSNCNSLVGIRDKHLILEGKLSVAVTPAEITRITMDVNNWYENSEIIDNNCFYGTNK